MHKHIQIFAALAATFPKEKVKQKAGFDYVTARTVMNRLDDVLGPAGWWDEYEPLGDGSILCRLTIELPDGMRLTKCDVGGISQTKDPSDAEKSGTSDALKRAAVKFGVGRYLYKDGIPSTVRAAIEELRDDRPAKAPAAPAGALPSPGDSTCPRPAPRTGADLVERLKEYDRAKGTDLLGQVVDWAKCRGLPARIGGWSAEQVAAAVAEVKEMIAAEAAAC